MKFIPAKVFHRTPEEGRSHNRTRSSSRQSHQSNQPPCLSGIWHGDLSTQTVCTSTSQWRYRSAGWRLCRRPNINRRRAYRTQRCMLRRWLMFPSPCQWSLPTSLLINVEFRINYSHNPNLLHLICATYPMPPIFQQPRKLLRIELVGKANRPSSLRRCLARDPTSWCSPVFASGWRRTDHL